MPLQGDILNQQIVELLLSPAKAGDGQDHLLYAADDIDLRQSHATERAGPWMS